MISDNAAQDSLLGEKQELVAKKTIQCTGQHTGVEVRTLAWL